MASIKSLAAQSIGLKVDGSVVVWDAFGGLSVTPSSVSSGVTAVATGGYHQLALKNGGAIAWGTNGPESTVPAYAQSGVTAIAAGNYYNMVLINGETKVWGYTGDSPLNVPVEAQSGVVAISSGVSHCMALTSTGAVVAWGHDYLDNTVVPPAARSGVVAISAGPYHCLALKDDGTVVAWGSWYDGECNVPAGLNHVVKVVGGNHNSYALKDDGSLVIWGFRGSNTVIPATAHDITDFAGGEFTTWVIRPTFPAESIVTPNTIWSNGSGTALVTLASPAPVGGATVSLSTNDGGVHVPATVTIPEGETTATYTVSADLSFGGYRSPKITSTYLGEPHSTNFYVRPHTASLTKNRNSVVAGSDQGVLSTITLDTSFSMPLTFDVASTEGIDLPASVTIPAGKTSVTFKALTQPTIPTGTYYDEWYEDYLPYVHSINATYQGNGGSFNFDVVPMVANLNLANSGYAGQYISGLIKLNGRPRFATSVPVTTDNAAIPPFNLNVGAGQAGTDFNMFLPLDLATGKVAVTAHLSGVDSTKSVSVLANALNAFTLSTSTVTGGGSVTGTVAVRYPVAADTVVALAVNKPGVTIPATVTILAGTNSATFTVSTSTTHIQKLVRITASRNGKSLKANLTVNP